MATSVPLRCGIPFYQLISRLSHARSEQHGRMFMNSACLSPMHVLPRLLFVVFGCGLVLAACDSFEKSVSPFDKTDELVVITVNSPDTYYENAEGGHAGLEFDLASEFARELGMKLCRNRMTPC